MATSRYSGAITPTQYVHKPLEAAFKVGLMKDAGIQDIIDSGQDFLNTEGNYATVFNPDTEYKIKKVKSLVQGMNDLVSGKLDDPVTQNKLRELRSTFSNDKEVYGAIQRTNAFNEYQKNVEKLGKDYRDQNALDYLDAVKRYQMGDTSVANILKLPPSIDPYYDYNKEFHDNLKDIGDMGVSFVNGDFIDNTTDGDFIDNTTGRFATDGKGGIVSDDRIGSMFLSGLSSEAYQQMAKDHRFEQYNGNTDKTFEEWVADRARSSQFSYSNAINKLDYTGRSLGYARLNKEFEEKESPLIPGSIFQPGSKIQGESPYYVSSDGKVRVNRNSKAEIDKSVGNAIASTPGVSAGYGGVMWLTGVLQNIFGDNDTLDVNTEGYKNLEQAAKNRGFIQDNWNTEEEKTKGVSDYLNFRQDATVQGSLVIPNLNSPYRKNYNEAFFPGSDGKGMVGDGLASNFSYADESGKIYTGKEFVGTFKGKPVSYSGTYEDVFSPHEYGSTEIAIDNGGQIVKVIQSPTITARQAPQYFANGILRASQSPNINKDGFAYNEFEIPSNSQSGASPGRYTSEELLDGSYRVTNTDTKKSKVYFINPQTGNLSIK